MQGIYKPVAGFACAVTILTFTAVNGHASLVTNGGFESGTTGWTIADQGGTVTDSTAYFLSGASSLLVDSTGAGAWTSPQAIQSFAATAGDEYNFQGSMLHPVGDPITDASFGLLKIVFRDGMGTDLVPASASIGILNMAFPGVESQPFVDMNSPTDSWILTEAQGVAPASTASVHFFLLNVNQGTDPGAVYFDDISATFIPEPGTLALVGLGALLLTVRRRR